VPAGFDQLFLAAIKGGHAQDDFAILNGEADSSAKERKFVNEKC
jgi:hypothetical protein